MNKPLAEPIRFLPSVAIPIAVTFAFFAVVNFLFWESLRLAPPTASPDEIPTTLSTIIFSKVPGPILVYLGSSVVALIFMRRAIRCRRLTCFDAGLSPSGWIAPRRLLALAMISFCCYYNITRIEMPQVEGNGAAGTESGSSSSSTDDSNSGTQATPDENSSSESPSPASAANAGAPSELASSAVIPEAETPEAETHQGVDQAAHGDAGPPPTHVAWGDYCFWFVFLLSASLTELLVFIGVGFCFLAKYLRSRGLNAPVATFVAAVFASVAFGLYHYTYPQFWWDYIYYPLMLVMMIDIALFVATRNIYLTFVLHNMFAAIGFTERQYSTFPFPQGFNPVEFQNGFMLMPVLLSFALPFLYMHLLERADRRLERSNP